MPCTIADPIVQACSGVTGTANDMISAWEVYDCPAAYSSALNTGPNGEYVYNPDQQALVQGCVQQAFSTYQTTYLLTDDITSSRYNNFQITLNSLCTSPSLPGVCTSFLTGYCTMGRANAIQSTTLINFCGCYVPPDPTTLTYTNNPACDSLCSRIQTSQKLVAGDTTGQLATCSENVCVLNDVTINTLGSRVSGGINFNSSCGGCGGGQGAQSCVCIISGGNIAQTLSSVGIGGNLNDFCGATSRCIVENADGTIVSDKLCTQAVFTPPPTSVSSWPNLFIVIIFIVILFVTIIFVVASRRQRDPAGYRKSAIRARGSQSR